MRSSLGGKEAGDKKRVLSPREQELGGKGFKSRVVAFLNILDLGPKIQPSGIFFLSSGF